MALADLVVPEDAQVARVDPEVKVVDLVVVALAVAADQAAGVPAAVDLAVVPVDVADQVAVDQVDPADPVDAAAIAAREKADAEALPAGLPGLAIVADAHNKVSAERLRSRCATRPSTQNLIPLAALTLLRPITRNCDTASAAAAP